MKSLSKLLIRFNILVTITILFFSCSNPVSPDVELLDNFQLPKEHNYYSLIFIDENLGWVVGKSGVIYKTTDGGKHWELQKSSSDNDLIKADFIDKNSGWIAGTNSVLLTEDGGKTWIQKLSNIPLSKSVSISFITKNIGWVSGTADGKIYHTEDGGSNWTVQQVDTLGRVVDLSFINESTGYAFSNITGIYRTKNGGKDWIKIIPPRFCSTIYFQDIESGFCGNNVMPSSIAVDKANIFYTSNGCDTWETQVIPEAMAVWKISFLDPNIGFAIIGGISSFSDEPTDWIKCGDLIITYNRGEDWQSCFQGLFNNNVIDFCKIGNNKIAVLTISGEIHVLLIK